MKEQTDFQKQTFRKRYIVTAIIILFLITSALIFILLSQSPKPDPASEKIIRYIVAQQLNKNPNELTDEDFVNITTLSIGVRTEIIPSMYDEGGLILTEYPEISDIKLLEKFTNLQTLDFFAVKLSDKAIPKWMKFLGKYGIINIRKRASLDLSPIEKLEHLKKIDFLSTPVKSFRPLSKIKNLETLSLACVDIIDFESLKKLKNIKTINLTAYLNITEKQIEELRKALPGVEIIRKTQFDTAPEHIIDRPRTLNPSKDLVSLTINIK